jgi:CubicO group peptidase (beta-lactamase class C family)
MSASGRLRSNVLDLARFMALHMNDGTLDGVQIISQESNAQMHARSIVLSGNDFLSMQLYGWGWGWQLWGGGGDLMGHTGGVPGFISQMVYRESEPPYGVVALTNAGCSVVTCDYDWLDRHFVAIRRTLMDEAAHMAEGR